MSPRKKQHRDRYAMLAALLDVGIAELDAQLRVQAWNAQLARWCDTTSDEAIGRTLGSLFPQTPLLKKTIARIEVAMQRGRSFRLAPLAGEAFLPVALHDDGPLAFQQQRLLLRPFMEAGQRRAMLVVMDVSDVAQWDRAMQLGVHEFRTAAQGARKEADRDALTGLLTRKALLRWVRQHGDQPDWEGGNRELALLMLDLDHFKRVNDSYGHAAGDAVLSQTARRINAKVRRTDPVARLGGEEFLVVMPGGTLSAGLRVGRGLVGAIASAAFAIPTPDGSGASIPVTVSAGLSHRPQGSAKSFEELLARADKALYAAKNGGRNQLQAFEE